MPLLMRRVDKRREGVKKAHHLKNHFSSTFDERKIMISIDDSRLLINFPSCSHRQLPGLGL